MAIPDEIPRGSLEYVSVVLLSNDDLTTGTVQVGLSGLDVSQPTSWLPAVWPDAGINVARTADPVNTANFEPGFYAVWAKVVDTPEVLPRPYGVVRIVAAGSASLADVTTLRRMVDELTSTTYGDAFLGEIIASNDGDLRKAAGVVWGMKAAAYAKLTDVTESGSSRNLGDRYEQAIGMSRFYGGTADSGSSSDSNGVTRVRQIQRPTAPNP